MKKMIFLVAGFAAVLGGAYGSSYLFAQGGGPAPAPAAQPGTKIAVVNIGKVFNEYTRAKDFKAHLEETLKPYKDKAKKHTDQIKVLEDELRTKPNLPQATQQGYADSIRSHKRALEDMSAEISRLLGKRQEENLVQLWKEVNMGIDAVAKGHGFQIVLGYGDPIEPKLLDQFPNVNRKMQAMDLGSTVPLYVHASVDISPIVVHVLNDWIRRQQEGVRQKEGVIPTGGNK